MDGKINYRHNTMTVQSLETFLNIKGGYHDGLRDVYFIRALGELPNLESVILDIDQKMESADASNQLLYQRISKFPRLVLKEDIDFYARAYDAWVKGQPITLKANILNELLKKTLAEALNSTLSIYGKVKVNCSETMHRNYTAKLLFWCDTFMRRIFSQWTERLSVKIIADNVVKMQEYLFLYLLTLLGCDVLIINNKSDIRCPEEISVLSFPLKLGPYGQTVLPEYEAREKKINNSKKSSGSAIRKNTSALIEHTEGQSGRICKQETKANQAVSNLTARTIVNSSAVNSVSDHNIQFNSDTNQAKEKSFEELAQLASSIVMIAVHNYKGEPVATGSGIIIRKNGFILTNYHVVKAGRIYAVRIEDDQEAYVTNEIIKYNPDFDLAIIRINKELKPLRIYDGKKLVRGQKVVAIGSPLGLFNSVSDGIISGFRDIKDINMIQFTAPISHGSSGGAVLNMQGDVIGISTAGIDSGQNINLAVNYETIRLFAKGFL